MLNHLKRSILSAVLTLAANDASLAYTFSDPAAGIAPSMVFNLDNAATPLPAAQRTALPDTPASTVIMTGTAHHGTTDGAVATSQDDYAYQRYFDQHSLAHPRLGGVLLFFEAK